MKRLALALLLTVPALAAPLDGEGLAPRPSAAVERRQEGNLVTEQIPPIPPALAERLLQYLNTRSVAVWDWDAQGQGLMTFTRFGETYQVHHVAFPGGARRQITFFEEPLGEATMNPAGGSFLFTKDVGGSEAYQIYLYDLAGGSWRLLTDGTSRYGEPLWSNRGDRLAFGSTARNATDWDIVVMDPARPAEARTALQDSGHWYPVDWSPDDRTLLVGKYVSINESYLYLVDLATGERTAFNPAEEPISYGAARFGKEGRRLFFTSDQGSEFQLLRVRDLQTGQERVLTEGIPWDVGALEISDDGRRLAFTVNAGGVEELYLLDTATLAHQEVRGLPAGRLGGLRFDPPGRRLALSINGPRTPGDAYVYDLEDGSLVQWTFSEVGGLDPSTFAEPELISYPSFDGREIPAFYYRPEGPGPHPVVVHIHGGPESQYVPSFSSLTQFLVGEMGFAVLAPNVRGSAGYGKSYLLLDNGYRREDSVKDIGALLDWVEGRPELDAGRVAVYGGSYGGYMVLASMAHYDDRLRAGVDVVGISNFVTFLTNTKDYRRDLRRAEYGDERVAEMRAFQERISPTTKAHKITRPLLVVQGLNDPRVPASEAEQIVRVVRENGGDVWYLLATDEGHGFQKKRNRDYYLQALALFLQAHLSEGAAGSR